MFEPSPSLSPGAARRWTIHSVIEALLPLALTGAGLLYPEPRVWFLCLAIGFVVLAGSVLGGAALCMFLATKFGARIQGVRRQRPPIGAEAFETARAMYVGACLLAWPMAEWRLGHRTGLIWSVGSGGELALICVESFVGLMVLDAWLYWKHRLLHTRLLFGFHKAHHAFRDPTPFAGFAVAPVEALLTFWPVLLVCIPAATHYAPIYLGLVIGFVNLNFYLHCGVTLGWVERSLPRVFLNTSAFHNVHHSRANTHFGEALYLWDVICRTRVVDEPPTAAS